MNTPRLLNIPVILGTVRKGRASEHAARLFADLLNRRAGVVSRVIDIATVPMPVDDAGEAIKDPAFAKAMTEADGLVIVSPEYNHSFPGLLKHVLDSCLSEYIHKAVGIVGVSAGPFAGARVIQGLLPVMREVGLVTIFWDVNIGTVAKVFAEDDRLLDDAVVRRAERFIRELIWMTKVLRHGREHVTVDEEAVERPAHLQDLRCRNDSPRGQRGDVSASVGRRGRCVRAHLPELWRAGSAGDERHRLDPACYT